MSDSVENKTITRADLAKAVYSELGFSFTECSELVDAVLEELGLSLEEISKQISGEAVNLSADEDDPNSVKIANLGRFDVKQKKERIGRNPKTKEEARISARKVVSFYASNLLKQRVNDNLT